VDDEAKSGVHHNIGEDTVGGILEQMEMVMEDRMRPRIPDEGRLVPIEEVLDDPLPKQIQLDDEDEDGDTDIEEGPQVEREVMVLERRVYPLDDHQQVVRNVVSWYLGNPLPVYHQDPPPAYVGGWGLDAAEPTPEVREEWRCLQEIQDVQQQAIDEEERAIDERSKPGQEPVQDHPPDDVVEAWLRHIVGGSS
jgi:hypothetical protein